MLSLRGIRVRRAFPGDAATGETVELPLVLTNVLGRRRQAVVLIEKVPFAAEPLLTTVAAPLGALEDRVLQRRALAVMRGEFPLGDVLLRGGDPAGLFCRQRRLELPGNLIVYPGDLDYRANAQVFPEAERPDGADAVFTLENDTGVDGANHAQDGVLIACGGDIGEGRAGQRVEASIYDVAPTVLRLLGEEIPDNMIGRIF